MNASFLSFSMSILRDPRVFSLELHDLVSSVLFFFSFVMNKY